VCTSWLALPCLFSSVSLQVAAAPVHVLDTVCLSPCVSRNCQQARRSCSAYSGCSAAHRPCCQRGWYIPRPGQGRHVSSKAPRGKPSQPSRRSEPGEDADPPRLVGSVLIDIQRPVVSVHLQVVCRNCSRQACRLAACQRVQALRSQRGSSTARPAGPVHLATPL